ILGVEALNNTTLKSLGINNGKAVFRLMHKNPQSTQTAVSSLETNENVIKCETAETDQNVKKDKRIAENQHSLVTDVSKRSANISETQEAKEPEIYSRNREIKIKQQVGEEENQMKASTGTGNYDANQFPVQLCNKQAIDNLNSIEFLGERNALVFNQATIQGVPRDELPDEFYDVTVEDAKVLLRDIKRYREELEDAPFLTNSLRQLNEEKRKLSQLGKYRYTIIRIQFPDQFVLQGLFKPTETVQAIKDFIKTYLIDANSDFIIFTTPPKQNLNPNAHLIDENLVPCAVIHYSGSSALRPEVKQKFTTLEKVALQVAKVRTSNKENQMINEGITSDTTKSEPICTNTKNESKSKVPKWFSPSLK
ncbi:tether containing UBX domain for GLUT4, partial [Ceratina calcarata]|uniref:Tether containing UBX domain for GLUT4 n=1 Tax=Ceratina calcarata TaxID=156304 RepID=A0AAJ7ISE4_9HYME